MVRKTQRKIHMKRQELRQPFRGLEIPQEGKLFFSMRQYTHDPRLIGPTS